MKQKKILFVFRSLGTGGSQKIQAFVANACVKRGYKVDIISMSHDKCSLDLDSKINVFYLDYDRVAINRDKPLKYLLSRIRYIFEFREKCKAYKPDLICTFLIDVVRLTVLALTGTKYPILASERGDPSQFSRNKIKQYNRALNKCAGVVFQLEQAAKFYNLNPDVIQDTIPNPAIVRNSDVTVNKNNPNNLFIFGAGRLAKQKRFDVLINAYGIVHNTHPEYRLKIYGDGSEMNNLKEQVITMGLTDYVDFMGNVKNIFQDINDKSIFVLTSDYEGIPNVITEALINEVPCISTDCSPGGARLLLNNGKCGDIVDCGNFEQLANSINKYIENPDYVKGKIENGKKHLKKFDPISIENKWLDLIERILINGTKQSRQ